MHGGYWTNMAMHYSDLLIAVGARFDDRVTGKLSEFCPEARVIHIDIDPTSIKKTFHAHIPIVGDVKAVLRQMNVICVLWMATWRNQGASCPMVKAGRRMAESPSVNVQAGYKIIKPQYVIERLYELTKHTRSLPRMWASIKCLLLNI